MWENQTAQQNLQLMPPGSELKQALTPPHTPKEKQQPNHILRAQLAVCLLLVALALLARVLWPQAYLRWGEAFSAALQSGVELNGQEQLLKFTGQVVNGARSRVKQVMARLEQWQAQPPASSQWTGAGGLQPARWPFVPQGSSLKRYQPPFALAQPLVGCSVTSGYGWRRHPQTQKSDFHTGIDLAAAEGTQIRPAAGGVVLKSAYSVSYGNNVLVLHTDGVTTRYCHMQYVFVRQGETVSQQTVLGTVGQTGVATGPHLHFELLYNDVRYDPAAALGLA